MELNFKFLKVLKRLLILEEVLGKKAAMARISKECPELDLESFFVWRKSLHKIKNTGKADRK